MELTEELTLRDFFRVIRRRRREFFVCWLSCFIASIIYTAWVTPIFHAESTLRIQLQDESSRSVDLGALNVIGIGASPTTVNIDQLLTAPILQETLKNLGRIKPGSSDHEIAAAVDDLSRRASVEYTDHFHVMIGLSVLSPSPVKAAAEANELSNVIVKQIGNEATFKAHSTKDFIEQQMKEMETRLHDSEDRMRRAQQKFGPQSAGAVLVNQLFERRNKRMELTQKYTESHPAVQQLNSEIHDLEDQLQKLPAQEVDIARITREVRLNEELYTMLTKRLEEARIMESAHRAPITLVEPAIEPVSPESPNKRYNLTLGFMAGLFLGLVIVLARQHFDTSMVTPEEIESYLQLPVLAAIPHIERRQSESSNSPSHFFARKRDPMGEARSRLMFHFPPQSPFAEVYHILRNNVMKTLAQQESVVLMFTSAVVSEGKSITSANFCIAAAQAGIPTLLVETDLRKPMVDKLFNLDPARPGLTDYFYTSPRWESYLATWEDIKKGSKSLIQTANLGGMANLHILPSGKLPPNPVSLLSSDRFEQLVKDMRRRYPLVVLDGAPTMLFADSAIIGRRADGVVMVYRFGRTAREVLSRAYNQLTNSNAKVLGVVVNDIVQSGSSSVTYSNYYNMYSSYANPHQKG